MKKSFSESPVGKFLLGKGFYAALAVCVLGAGAAAWVIVDKTIDSFTSQPPAVSGTTLQNTASSAPASQKNSRWSRKSPMYRGHPLPPPVRLPPLRRRKRLPRFPKNPHRIPFLQTTAYPPLCFLLRIRFLTSFPVQSWSRMKHWTNGTPITVSTSKRNWALPSGQ